MLNLILILLIIIGIGAFLFFYLRKKKDEPIVTEEYRFDLKQIEIFVKNAFKDIINESPYAGNPSEEEFARRKNRKKELRAALRNCLHGDIAAKNYVKLYIKDMLKENYGFNETNINSVIPFDRPERLSEQDRFEILLYSYKKIFKKDALNQLISKYGLNTLKRLEDGEKRYQITRGEIKEIYDKEKPKLSFEDKLNIIVQRVYQNYKGFGPIDEIRDQKIEGVSGGVSGIPESVASALDFTEFEVQPIYIPRNYDSIWIFYKGISINLEFLSFGSEKELKRVCQNIYTYGNPGQLNEARGFISNDMADGSRVVVLRPKVAESWAFFVRKHDFSYVRLSEQIHGQNAELAIQMLTFLVYGSQTIALTGRQGSGKTTLVKGLIDKIQCKNIRVQEQFFELWLRKMFPHKNILSLRETPTVSAQAIMDITKKTDGTMNIVGEASSHEIVSLAIQAGLVASEYTIVTHHGNTFQKMINALRNSLIAAGDFNDEKAAEEQVVSWLNFNVHCVLSGTGERYISRITQCVPVFSRSYSREYKNATTVEQKIEGLNDTIVEFASRTTDAKTYEERDVIVWNEGKYEVKDSLTPDKVSEMLGNMDEEERELFRNFLSKHWGNAA
ncbi:pilus assembly protein CpaF [Paenibacillus sp. FSL H7-0326]|uniref:ATPase, T2SS/T4P/T4SS family n=1 Tax=Paenibacillus sp. FSL H7-0326 TaxID=1921144 RepID=UPI00096D9E1F|nr:ATPase, T2SS/T4P/T4SS family [Paenibacillus sp. FSL H7-0326]OMC63715.1 pilus assembly protein CpaF [Paenibacillus sp. FSL H7-0326]